MATPPPLPQLTAEAAESLRRMESKLLIALADKYNVSIESLDHECVRSFCIESLIASCLSAGLTKKQVAIYLYGEEAFEAAREYMQQSMREAAERN